jgi:hypothetical protein
MLTMRQQKCCLFINLDFDSLGKSGTSAGGGDA